MDLVGKELLMMVLSLPILNIKELPECSGKGWERIFDSIEMLYVMEPDAGGSSCLACARPWVSSPGGLERHWTGKKTLKGKRFNRKEKGPRIKQAATEMGANGNRREKGL